MIGFMKRQGSRVMAVAVAVALATSCGASVSTKATSTTRASGDGATTTKPTTAPATTKPSTSVTVNDLKALLPSASDIGSDYREVPNDKSDDNDSQDKQMDDAMEKACPEAAAFMNSMDKASGPSADRSFKTDDGRQVKVELTPQDSAKSATPVITKQMVNEVVDAINACTTISVDVEGGIHLKMDLDAMVDKEVGDYGMALRMKAEMTGAILPGPVEMKLGVRMFQVGPVTAAVTVMSGIDDKTLTAVPGDFDLLSTLPPTLDKDIAELVGRS